MRLNTSTRLNQIMSERNLKQVDILNLSIPYQNELDIKMGKSALSQYVNGIQSPDQDRIFLLSKTLNVSEPWLMGYDVSKERIPDTDRIISFNQNSLLSIYTELTDDRKENVFSFAKEQLSDQQNDTNKLKTVPLVGSTAANPVELSYGDTIYDESVEINVPGTADCALVVQGDSMEPEFMNGSIVFYKLQKIVESGELAIVEVDGNGVTFKRVCFDHDNQKVVLKSLNEKYDDRTLNPEQVRIIGKVVQ